jgi:hypothetical protein
VPTNVRCASYSNRSGHESELKRRADNDTLRCSKQANHAITGCLFDQFVGGGSSVCGMVRPSVLVVLRLITSSNLLGSWIGRSAGLAPLRMRSMYPAAWRTSSTKSVP